MMMTVYAIIPARGGSQGVPRKNLRIIAGAPLIAHILRAAHASTEIDHVFVSTEDDAISETALSEGAWVIRHPPSLSTNSRVSFGVVRYMVRQWRSTGLPDILVVLRATAPLTLAEDIDAAIQRLRKTSRADSVVGVVETLAHPYRVYKINSKNRLVPFWPGHTEKQYPRRRQTFQTVYMRTAGLYVIRPQVILGGSLWGNVVLPHIMPRERAVNINDEFDFKVAEMLLQERKQNSKDGS